MNQQSDSTDLLGGYKPVMVSTIISPLREQFELLFCKTFSRKQNQVFLSKYNDNCKREIHLITYSCKLGTLITNINRLSSCYRDSCFAGWFLCLLCYGYVEICDSTFCTANNLHNDVFVNVIAEITCNDM